MYSYGGYGHVAVNMTKSSALWLVPNTVMSVLIARGAPAPRPQWNSKDVKLSKKTLALLQEETEPVNFDHAESI